MDGKNCIGLCGNGICGEMEMLQEDGENFNGL